MAVCIQCGQDNPDGFRFCGNCGKALVEPAPLREARKTVTLLFCDVSGSTALGERLDPETLRHVMRRYFDVIGSVIERHGGTVEKFAGDAVMAVFGVPQVREDDALRAVRAAAEIRDSLPAVASELGVTLAFRTGVNTGEVVVGTGQTLATGDAVNVAARLEQAAAPGEILIGAQTLRLVRDVVDAEPVEPLALRGKAEAVTAHRLFGVTPGAPGRERVLAGSMIGREPEMRLLRGVFERAVGERRCYLFTLLGAAGVGKSRLVREFLQGVADGHTVARGRCLPYGEGITFSPLVEVLTALGEPAADVLRHVAEGGATSAGELFFEVRRLLDQVASERPLILVVDDLHWAEPTLLDLIDHITDMSREAPILLLCIARPELLEERVSWAGGKLNATTTLLEPLPLAAAEQLVEQLTGRLDALARGRIVAAGEGNPLFLEEMVALALEGGEFEVPPTIQALLAARLERLAEPERGVMERGAVEGKVFHRRALRDLSPPPLQAGIDSNLAALVRMELIRPDESLFTDDEAYRFRHLLIRDAAYDSLPKGRRAELHAAFAGWLEVHGRDLVELDEVAGWHLEQALGYRQELGLAGQEATAERAAGHLLSAGTRAALRADFPASENLLERALRLLPSDHPSRGRVALGLADALLQQDRFDEAERFVDEAESDPEVRPEAVLVRQEWLFHSRPEDVISYSERELPAAIALFERAGDDRLLAKALCARANVRRMTGTFGPSVDDGFAAIDHARRAGDRGLLSQALIDTSDALLWGPADRTTMHELLSAIDWSDGGPSSQAFGIVVRAVLAGRERSFDDARALFVTAMAMMDQVGLRAFRFGCTLFTSRMELESGHPAAAVAQLRRARDELEMLHDWGIRTTVTAALADALYADGQATAAEEMARAAETDSAPDDAINFAIAHGVLARIAADRGDFVAARRMAESAVEWAYRMDQPAVHADALWVRAHVLLASGERAEADAVLGEAIDIYERKGELAGAARVRRAFAGAFARE